MSWKTHERTIIACEKCPRLRRHCREIARVKRKAYANQTYWGKPIIGFGDTGARLVIIGLAPAAHGGNRTGRMFTGDRSGDWLYRALYVAGFANQATSSHCTDGLRLKDAFVTAAVKCAPPDNKPLPAELDRCAPYLSQELESLKQARVYLALGKIGFDAAWRILAETGQAAGSRPAFTHGAEARLESGRLLLASYHPSQQNTFTGKLTESMFNAIFTRARSYLST